MTQTQEEVDKNDSPEVLFVAQSVPRTPKKPNDVDNVVSDMSGRTFKVVDDYEALVDQFCKLDQAIGERDTSRTVLDHRKSLHDIASMDLLSPFMASCGERITWVESREIWSGMCKTNNGTHASLVSTWNDQKDKHLRDDEIDGKLSYDYVAIARGIKEAYSIRLSEDHSEQKFILLSVALLWTVVFALAIAGYTSGGSDIGKFSKALFIEAGVLFVAELVWETILSWVVLRYNIKINYSRKLGNLLKVPKYFVADFLPFYRSTALSMFTTLAINQTLFCLIFYRASRVRVPYFSYVFLSQDRREDRPDTLIFQVTEDMMRFFIYFPFKIFVVNYIQAPAIIFIPILINNIGDGLAEPVGVRYGKHKYTTTALYYKGKFWNGEFTRSYEGSSCVFLTSLIVIACNYSAFTETQFYLTIVILPFLMTIAEAKAPHTNDGPFLALIGCGFLSLMFFVVP